MKLITEISENVKYLQEESDSGSKSLYITGPFMMYNTKNRNGRVYPKEVMESAVTRYVNEKVNNGCAYGELNHPSGPNIDLDRVCIIIKELNIKDDNKVWGKALVTSTPKGDVVKGLMESGANLGVSSRGLGSLKQKDQLMEVQNDFRLVTGADVVADPSAHEAYVKGILENVDYFYNDSTGEYMEETKKQLKKMSTREIEEKSLLFFEEMLRKI
jgi:hypothetical protein